MYVYIRPLHVYVCRALLRPGRFDVEVQVFPPDLKGRRDILDHYMSKVKVCRGQRPA